MRILLLGPRFMGRWTEASQTALQALGHQVYKFYFDQSPNEFRAIRLMSMTAVWSQQLRGSIHSRLYRRWLSVKHRNLTKLARDFSPQLIIVLKGETIPLNVLERLRRELGVPIVTWWVDDPFRFPGTIETYSSYDHFFVFDGAYIPRLEDLGVRRLTFLPCACDIHDYHQMNLSGADRRRYSCEVAFVGWFYSQRGQLVTSMAGLDVAVWGPGWQLPEAKPVLQAVGANSHRGHKMNSRDAARLYNVAKICVNNHHDQSVYNGLNIRSFEVPACGGFQLVDNLRGIHELFTPGEEVVCYESYDQARELADYYLERPEERAEIGRRGRERVLREHTYRHRMETLLESVKDLL